MSAPRLARNVLTPKQPKTSEGLRAAKAKAYEAVEGAGVTYKPTTFNGLITVMGDELRAAKFNARRHKNAASMLREIETMRGKSPSLTELDQLRQVIRRDVVSRGDDAEAAMGQIMIRQIDDFIGVAGPKQVVAGDAKAAAGLIKDARDLNTRYRKVEAIEDAVDSASLRAGSTGTGGNVDNATRQNMRRLLESETFWSPAEAAKLEQIIRGTRGQNLLRLGGRFAPNSGAIPAMATVGATAINPLGAIPGVLGMVSKAIADGATQRRVQALIRDIASGKTQTRLAAHDRLAEMAAKDPQVAKVYKELASAMLVGSAPVAATAQPETGPR